MSMSMIAFLKEIPDLNRLKKAIDELDLPIQFENDFEFSAHNGGCFPCSWRGANAELEVWLDTFDDPKRWGLEKVAPLVSDKNVMIIWIWGSSLNAACVGQAACAALIQGYDASIFSAEGGCFMSIEDLHQTIRELEKYRTRSKN